MTALSRTKESKLLFAPSSRLEVQNCRVLFGFLFGVGFGGFLSSKCDL